MARRRARIRRVASSPSMPGRFTSITTRSGSSLLAIVTASSPEAARPMTSKPGVSPTRAAITASTGGWSSTNITRTAATSLPSLTRPMIAGRQAGRQGASHRAQGGTHRPWQRLPVNRIGL